MLFKELILSVFFLFKIYLFFVHHLYALMCNFLKSLCIHTTYLSFLFMNFKLNILFMVLILHWNVEITINHMDWSFSCASFCLICLLRMQISMEIWDFWEVWIWRIFVRFFDDLGGVGVLLESLSRIHSFKDFPSKFRVQILIFYSHLGIWVLTTFSSHIYKFVGIIFKEFTFSSLHNAKNFANHHRTLQQFFSLFPSSHIREIFCLVIFKFLITVKPQGANYQLGCGFFT